MVNTGADKMKLVRILAIVLACGLGASSVKAGSAAVHPGSSGGSSVTPIAVWLVMGCATSIIFAAFLASRTQNRELSGREATTCGFAYWLNPQGR
jgi:hypothetical protein